MSKYRIRKTGEIVDVISYSGDRVRSSSDNVSYIDSKGVEHHSEKLNLYWDLEEIKEIDWEEKRYELAKETLLILIEKNPYIGSLTAAYNAKEYADELIKKLRSKNLENPKDHE